MNAFVDQSEQEFHLGRGHPYLAGFMTFSFSTLFEMFQKLFDAELLKKNNLELENTADNWISKMIDFFSWHFLEKGIYFSSFSYLLKK